MVRRFPLFGEANSIAFFEDNAARLRGKRIFLRCYPIEIEK
jgi:hypothetical protein